LSGFDVRYVRVICAFLLLSCSASTAQAQDLRVQRTTALNLSPALLLPATTQDLDIYRGFLRWRARYIRPVFCGMIFCGGSCAAYNDACLMPVKGEILTRVGGLSCEGEDRGEGDCRTAAISKNRD
jgi:hypothetical protein